MKIVRLMGYFSWFGFCFVVGAILTAPLDSFRPLLSQTLERQLGKGKQGQHGVDPVVTIDKIGLSGLGVKAKRVHMQLASSEPEPGPDVDIDEVWISLRSLASLPTSSKRIDASASLYGGDVAVVAALDEKNFVTEADLEVDDVDLGKVPALMQKLGVPLTGVVNVDVELEMGKQPEKDAVGHVNIDIKGVSAGPGALKIPGSTFELPEAIKLGDIKGRIPVKQGVGTIETFGVEGVTDVEAAVNGTLNVKPMLQNSRLDLDGWFKPTPGFLEKNGKIKSAIELGEQLGPLKRAKDDDARYHFTARGAVQALQPQLSRDGGKKALSRAARATPPPAPTDVDKGEKADAADKEGKDSD